MAAPSLADRYHAHGEAFKLSLELGITPRAAEAVIRDRQARLRWLAGEQRRVAQSQPPLDFTRDERTESERSEPWMMRE